MKPRNDFGVIYYPTHADLELRSQLLKVPPQENNVRKSNTQMLQTKIREESLESLLPSSS